jgi:hypothetical protein
MYEVLEYTGMTALTVVGGFTRRTYRFAEPGARQQVDARDLRTMAGVPHLRRCQRISPA